LVEAVLPLFVGLPPLFPARETGHISMNFSFFSSPIFPHLAISTFLHSGKRVAEMHSFFQGADERRLCPSLNELLLFFLTFVLNLS